MGKCLFMRKGETHTAPSIGILASDLSVGSTVKLMENGIAVEYLVVNKGIPSGSSLYDESCDGIWLLRKDIKEKRAWDSSNVNDYKNSTIHKWLNEDFFNLFSSVEQAAIKHVKIPYFNGSGENGSVSSGTNGLQTKVFLLSAYELGFTPTYTPFFPIDGACLDYFIGTEWEDSKRIANLDNVATKWWIRSLYNSGGTNEAWVVLKSGYPTDENCSNSAGIRPSIILPSTALFDTNTLILKGVA